MTTAAEELDYPNIELSTAVDIACRAIAPNWPLDRSIAVNPWWQLRDQPFAEVAAKLQRLGRIRCLMPRDYYAECWRKGRVQPAQLEAACRELQQPFDQRALLAALDAPEAEMHWLTIADLRDTEGKREHRMHWHDEVTQQISQYCGLYFQYGERLHSNDSPQDFYHRWLDVVRQDRGIEVLMGERGLAEAFCELPEDMNQLFDWMYDLCRAPEGFADYLLALLLDMNGWASWMAFQDWEAQLQGHDSDAVKQFLALRLAWEWVIFRQLENSNSDQAARLAQHFRAQFGQQSAWQQRLHGEQQVLWVWQRALELGYQLPLHRALRNRLGALAPREENRPLLQVAMCIDVRSEPMRRALEAQSPRVKTIGFAGFFGLPLEYTLLDGRYSRPQLPGLLAPAIQARQPQAARHDHEIASHAAAHRSGESPAATFGLVEGKGLMRVFGLLRRSLSLSPASHSINRLGDDSPWELSRDGAPLTLAEQVELAAGILQAMGLTENFANHVLLLGHGSCSANNPHAASLDCGACGGQTGEVNVKVLAQLLNDRPLREALALQGIDIPADTQFIAGLHNTTTDQIELFSKADTACQHWLQQATEQAQRSRAHGVQLEPDDPHLSEKFEQRSRDWSELRPEWGLANNAAFIVAPRRLTQDLDLAGRSFLHDYDWRKDREFKILELIMTAPMVVTNWINLQYFASSVDNDKFGSGNKLLHNVVGGHIGVFEGNGGDLRMGLSKQSLHDGHSWRHEPQRLSVYLAAPASAIEAIIDKHDMVRHLIDNDWLYLFQLSEQPATIQRYYRGQWQIAETEARLWSV